MSELWEAFKTAIHLLVTFDPEVVQIAWRSLWIAATSCAVCVVICIPLGNLIYFSRFRGKGLLISVIQTLYSMPTVAVGLIVVMLSADPGRSGCWAFYSLLR